ncbi:MAG: hypothetical protein J6G98_00690 [Bacilli bacterium]|nr:hypothetical protein [Bacilli bacterium]
MKKNIVLVVVTVLATLSIILLMPKDKLNKMDALKFKAEYESLNNKKNDSNKEYVPVSINSKNPYVYATYDEVMDILNGKTGVIYFGFPECPWCRNMVSVLSDAAKEMGIDKIYYFNALDIRDKKSLDENGKIITEKEGTDEYYNLVDKLKDYLTPYEGLNDESIKRLYFPTVVFVKDGNIIGTHIGTLDSQENPYVVLNDSEKEELKSIYMDYINKVYEIVCDEAC